MIMLDPTSENEDLTDRCPYCFGELGQKGGQVVTGLFAACPHCGKRMMRSKMGYVRLRDGLVNKGAVIALLLIVFLIDRYA